MEPMGRTGRLAEPAAIAVLALIAGFILVLILEAFVYQAPPATEVHALDAGIGLESRH